jgi:hypothetical protein
MPTPITTCAIDTISTGGRAAVSPVRCAAALTIIGPSTW